MHKNLLASLVAVALVTASVIAEAGAPIAKRPLRMEIIVRTGKNIRSIEDAEKLVLAAKRHGVAVINLLVKQDEDRPVPSGQVYYQSALAPVVAGYEHFDALDTVLGLAHRQGIKVRAWMPQFHDQVAALRHPEWQMMVVHQWKSVPYTGSKNTEFFVNPLDPAVQAYQLALISEIVQKYPIDGIVLDWLRFDDYPMDVGRLSREAFQTTSGVDALTIDFSRNSEIRDQWNEFRTDGIAAYVAAVRRLIGKDMTLGVYILPPDFVEVGQDAAKFDVSVNFLAPMCYSRDWGYQLPWIWENCMATTQRKAGHSSVIPTLDSGLSNHDYQYIMQHLRDDFPLAGTVAWFLHGKWTDAIIQRLAEVTQ